MAYPARFDVKRHQELVRWRASSPFWRRRFARSAGIWALLAVAATACYIGFVGTNSQASVSETLSTFSQCWVNRYDCSDFATQAEAQEVFWACGGRKNDVHRRDRDRDGWACERLP